MDVEPMFVTDAAIGGGCSPCKADGSPREVPKGEEIGQAVVIMVDGGEGVKESLKTFSPTKKSIFKGAACLLQDLKNAVDTIFFTCKNLTWRFFKDSLYLLLLK